jgi:hypothetical protein
MASSVDSGKSQVCILPLSNISGGLIVNLVGFPLMSSGYTVAKVPNPLLGTIRGTDRVIVTAIDKNFQVELSMTLFSIKYL